MALILTNVLELILQPDCGAFTINDNIVYGGSNPARATFGNVLVGAHINTDETEDYLTIDSTPYTSKISYNVSNTLDGHYHFELLLFNSYNSGTAYHPEIRDSNNIITTYASLIYYPTTSKFYKNIQASTGIAPDAINGIAYWQEIIDFTNSEVRLNTTIQVAIFDTVALCRSIKCVKDTLYNIVIKDPACLDVKTLLPYLKKAIYLAGAKIKNTDTQPVQAEVIVRTLANLCPQC